jgi:sugar/nucleoside kinase (ribokinase family)
LTNETASPSFCVFGGALIDRVGLMETEYFPGQSHPGHWQQTIGGVASNVARHLAHFGAEVTFASVFSDDGAAQTIREQLTKDGLRIVADCTIPGGTTPTYTVMHDPSGEVIAGLADMTLHQHMDEAWARQVASAGAHCSCWVADTNIAPSALAELARLKGNRRLFLVVVSPAKTSGLACLYPLLDGIICNRQEAEALEHSIFPDAVSAAQSLIRSGLPSCIVSDGAKPGAFACSNSQTKKPDLVVRAPLTKLNAEGELSTRRLRMTGAGDMFAAGCLFALCAQTGIAPENILQLGHAAARLAMQEDDTCPSINWRAVTGAANLESL